MNHTESAALFRAHATARLTGDTIETARLAAHIGDEQRMSHLLFTLTLFTQFVVEELGCEPDPADLAALTKRLHDKHYRPERPFEALRAEAMIRAVTAESVLLTEIPHTEQAAYMWAVIDELADPKLSASELDELFDLVKEARDDLLGKALDSPELNPARHEQVPATSAEEGTDA
ncbi:hypothetical protein [Glycomyces tritici]|uniref:Co-chaperone DjlA N-terminal domain-containing protein n=1 Tax=Glycomyces tritici TaxID=2665176 RepID=A0ABT7YT70_9ACTN|nr:hypothetical protein [Glycomyces tritici]MDN3241842.1 hypothetical protein [Glycomyces tritici]MDN3243689.1 hypothetical protein [Glycomyces tritici]